MRKFLGYSPPFHSFLIEMLNTGRVMIIENSYMVSAVKEYSDSG